MRPSYDLRYFLFGSTLLATSPSLHATPYYWNTTTTGSWTTGANWSNNATSGGTTGTVPPSTDTVVFNQSSVNGAEIITLSGATSISGITFNNTGTTTIRSDTSGTNRVLTIGAGGITMASGAGQSEISVAGTAPQPTVSVALSASQEWKNQSNATLFVRNGGSLGTNTLTLTTTGSGSVNFGGNVTGSGNIVVSANSLVAMAGGGSSYSGTTTINSGGVLTINALTHYNTACSLGNKTTNLASNLVIDGGTLRVQVSATDSDRLFTMGAGGATFEATNTGANSGQIKLTNTAAIAYSGVGNRSLTLGGASDDTNGSSIALDIADVGGGNGIVGLVKNGTHAWTVSGAGNSYSGGSTVNAGTLTMGSASALGSTSGQLTVNGGTLNMAANSLTVGNLTGTGGTISGTSGSRLLTIGQGDGTGGNFQGAIDNGGGGTTALTKTGTGTITLSGTNGYTGDTTVSAGVLAVNGSLANTSTTVTGGTLRGSGNISGSVTVQSGGTLAAGNSIESLTTGALSLGAGSTFAYEINKDAAVGAAGDLTAVTGTLTLDTGNTAILTLAELGTGPGTWDIGEKLTLISYTGSWNNGLFKYLGATVADDSTITFSGASWLFDYNDNLEGSNYTAESSGNYVTMTVVPEPDAAALLGGLGTLLLLRRRR